MSVESKMRNAPFEDLDDELEYLANGKGGPTNGHGHRNMNGHRRRYESTSYLSIDLGMNLLRNPPSMNPFC